MVGVRQGVIQSISLRFNASSTTHQKWPSSEISLGEALPHYTSHSTFQPSCLIHVNRTPTDISEMPANPQQLQIEPPHSRNHSFPEQQENGTSFRTALSSFHTQLSKKQLRQLGEPDPPKYFTTGSKWGNTLHAGLRMDMAQLNSHLHVIQKVPSPQYECGYRNENINHFSLNCLKYDSQREELFDSISRTSKSDFRRFTPKQQLRALLYGVDPVPGSGGGPEVAIPFQTFLLKSKRFTHP